MTTNEIAPQKFEKHVRGNGVQRFAKACSRTLRDNSEALAIGLFRSAAEGNTGAARLLLKVLEKHPAARIHKKRAASGKKALIEALAQLQWIVAKPGVRQPLRTNFPGGAPDPARSPISSKKSTSAHPPANL